MRYNKRTLKEKPIPKMTAMFTKGQPLVYFGWPIRDLTIRIQGPIYFLLSMTRLKKDCTYVRDRGTVSSSQPFLFFCRRVSPHWLSFINNIMAVDANLA